MSAVARKNVAAKLWCFCGAMCGEDGMLSVLISGGRAEVEL
jgi:hypothetical protein